MCSPCCTEFSIVFAIPGLTVRGGGVVKNPLTWIGSSYFQKIFQLYLIQMSIHINSQGTPWSPLEAMQSLEALHHYT